MRRNRNATVTVSDSLYDAATDVETDLEIDCKVSPFVPARLYPTDSAHPAEGGEVESHEVYELRSGKRIRREDLDGTIDLDRLNDKALDALGDGEPDPDDEADRRREVRAERDW